MSKGFLIVSQYYIFVLNQFEEEAEDGCRGSDQRNEPEMEPTEQGRGRVNLKTKIKTRTWSKA